MRPISRLACVCTRLPRALPSLFGCGVLSFASCCVVLSSALLFFRSLSRLLALSLSLSLSSLSLSLSLSLAVSLSLSVSLFLFLSPYPLPPLLLCRTHAPVCLCTRAPLHSRPLHWRPMQSNPSQAMVGSEAHADVTFRVGARSF